MSDFILDQLGFIRRQTINYVKDISDSAAEIIPEGLRNNIKWNLGHMYIVQEKFAFQLTGKETKFPANINKLFDPGTKPSDWDMEPPRMSQLIDLLTKQIERVESALSNKLKEEINPHYKSSTGLTFTTVEQLLGFSIYHEAMHFATIKNIKSIINS
jgi:uncharacterized damage-inducible protein DinB